MGVLEIGYDIYAGLIPRIIDYDQVFGFRIIDLFVWNIFVHTKRILLNYFQNLLMVVDYSKPP